MTHILYGVVLESQGGGQQMNSFLKKESALEEIEKLKEEIVKQKVAGVKVYLSELDYDKHNNRLLSSSLINKESKLMHEC